MSPDQFWKDSHVGDPQSWNKYAYARNNPLRYVDPTGQNATVTGSCSTDSQNQTTCNVNISATIAIYGNSGSELTQDQLNAAATTIQKSIDNAWTGSFQDQGGVTYNVTTQVSVSVYDNRDAAMASGAQNVVGMANGPVKGPNGEAWGGDIDTKTLGHFLAGGPDVGQMSINNLASTAMHEFTHMLGTDDKQEGVSVSEAKKRTATRATASDFGFGIQEFTQAASFAREWSYGGPLHSPSPSGFHFSTSVTVGAPLFGAWWK
jgi:hypothetical protein